MIKNSQAMLMYYEPNFESLTNLCEAFKELGLGKNKSSFIDVGSGFG